MLVYTWFCIHPEYTGVFRLRFGVGSGLMVFLHSNNDMSKHTHLNLKAILAHAIVTHTGITISVITMDEPINTSLTGSDALFYLSSYNQAGFSTFQVS